ncbi:cilia- and flagella-associated protein 119 isoform X2 [Pseudophryne corroboree]|uniref:cilia- and flagella-associated protein 119 isoform X2 n=1 Tax=Pseudophryne corroboree TaxID=495146 RepID=UPI003081E08B
MEAVVMGTEVAALWPGHDHTKPPKMKKPQICLWKDLSEHDMETLERAEDLHRALAKVLSLEGGLAEPRTSVLLDLYYYTLRFCWECGFTRVQTSSFFSIMKETHAVCQGSPLLNEEECYVYFQQLLLCHAVHRPPFSISLFTLPQALRISDYFLNTYFRQFKLYKYVFTPQVKLDLSISCDGISESEVTSDQGPGLADTTSEETGEVPTAGGFMDQQDESREGLGLENTDQRLGEEVAKQPNGHNLAGSATGSLREYIDQRLSVEMGRLKKEVDEKLHQTEEHLQGCIRGMEETRGQSARGKKGGKRQSAKGK